MQQSVIFIVMCKEKLFFSNKIPTRKGQGYRIQMKNNLNPWKSVSL